MDPPEIKNVLQISIKDLCPFLEGNNWEQVELFYYVISSHFNDISLKERWNKVVLRILTLDHYHLLDVMPVYHHTQNQEKLMTQSPENGQKRRYGPNFGHYFGPYLAKIFFSTH